MEGKGADGRSLGRLPSELHLHIYLALHGGEGGTRHRAPRVHIGWLLEWCRDCERHMSSGRTGHWLQHPRPPANDNLSHVGLFSRLSCINNFTLGCACSCTATTRLA